MTVQRGVCIAFDDATLEPAPTWTSLYDYHDDGLRVTQWQIDRGRQYETESMNTGSLVVTIKDFNGILDATNAFSPFAGKIKPLKQIAVFLTNPLTGVESSRYRGFIASVETEIDASLKYMIHTITAVDLQDIIANAEVIPDSSGDTVPTESIGDVFYEDGPVNVRILAALADAGIPAGLVTVFSGNVDVQETVYAPQTKLLAVIDDAVEAEFPGGVATRYVDKDGIFTFHGRYARFNPDDVDYHISKWNAGTGDYVDLDPAHVALISGLEFSTDKETIYNAVLATPQNIVDGDIPGQMVTDPTSIGVYGVRSLSFPNLITKQGHEGPPLSGKDEVKQYGTYHVNNYKQPRTRVSQIQFTTRRDTDPALGAWWKLICGVDLNDIVTLTTTHPGGGGFNDDFFVEGIHETAKPLRDNYPELDVQLDVSPRSYFANSYPDGPG